MSLILTETSTFADFDYKDLGNIQVLPPISKKIRRGKSSKTVMTKFYFFDLVMTPPR